MRNFLAIIALLWAQSAWATNPNGDNCDPVLANDTAATLMSDLALVVYPPPGNAPGETPPDTDIELPAGTLNATHIKSLLDSITKKGGSFTQIFPMMADGKSRVLPGDTLRELLKDYETDMSFLPLENLKEIRSDGKNVDLVFDFGGQNTKNVKIPGTTSLILESSNLVDPYSASNPNTIKKKTGTSETLRISNTVRFSIDKNGITGLRKGDIKASWFLGWANINIRSAQGEKVATVDNKPVIRADEAGNPIIEDGHYVPETYNDWLIITAPATHIEIGVPAITPKEETEEPVIPLVENESNTA